MGRDIKISQTNKNVFNFEELKTSPLLVDAIYKGGKSGNITDEVLTNLLGVANSGGIRISSRKDGSKLPAYVVLFSTGEEVAWPDELDETTGIFRYYGDNKKSGRLLQGTSRKGNKYLENMFYDADAFESRNKVPPIFVFKKVGSGRDVQFKGLAVPGRIGSRLSQDLVAVWRSKNNLRFQNYEAYFTLLDQNIIERRWLDEMQNSFYDSCKLAPEQWKVYIKKGIKGIKPLQSQPISIPSKKEQLPQDKNGLKIIKVITDQFPKNKACAFEAFAINLIQMSDKNFVDFKITQPSRDGGRDGIGKYRIGTKNTSVLLDCVLEAKCYSISNSVGVRETSRLISRIKNKQFGILVTTSYLGDQAYKEIVEDGHPVLIITARDIVEILKSAGISSPKEVLKLLSDIT